jgi:DNA-binding LacI/PurR family transcriptional regulator
MKDVARRAGVHKSTVSLALRKHPSIPEATAARLRRIAQEMGYHPEPALSLIAAHRWNTTRVAAGLTLAYILPRSEGAAANPRRYVAGARARVEQRGGRIEVFSLADYPNAAALGRVLYNRGIGGLLLAPIPHTASPLELDFDWDKFSVVCCSLGWARPLLHTVSYDVFSSVRRAWHELRARGYRRIGPAIFSHTPLADHDYGRLGAVLCEQAEMTKGDRVPPLRSDFGDREAFAGWLKKYRPDAVLSFHTGARSWMRDAGLNVPRDAGLACLQMRQREGVAGMFTPPALIAEVAVDFVISCLRDNERGLPRLPRNLLIEPEWCEGETLRPRPTPAAPAANASP